MRLDQGGRKTFVYEPGHARHLYIYIYIYIYISEEPLPRPLCFATHMKIAVLLNKTNGNLKKNQNTYSKTPILGSQNSKKKQKPIVNTHTWEAQTHKNQKTLGKNKNTIKTKKNHNVGH